MDQKSAPVTYNHSFFCQTPKSCSKMLFKLTNFHINLYFCVKYWNVEYEDEIFKPIIKSNA